MPNKELIDYIKNLKEQGFPEDVIREQLVKTGYQEEDITLAIRFSDENNSFVTEPKIKPIYVMISTGVVIMLLIIGLFIYLSNNEGEINENINTNLGKVNKLNPNSNDDKNTSMGEENIVNDDKNTNVDEESVVDDDGNTSTNETDVCTESWACSSWSACSSGTQTRTCTDSNECGTTINKSSESRSCTETCTESWTCYNWSTCIDGTQTRACTDSNKCGTTTNKPSNSQDCSVPTTPSCTDSSEGKDYFTKGTTSVIDGYGEKTYDDICSPYPEGQLTEYYCNQDKIAIEKYMCLNGCKDGACIEEEEEEESPYLQGDITVSWSSKSGDSYSDPKISIGGTEYNPHAYAETPSKWCQAVPSKSYSSYKSVIKSGNKLNIVKWYGTGWVLVPSSDSYADYPTLIECRT